MDKTMADKLMYIPNDNTQNYHFCRIKLMVAKFDHSTKLTNQKNSLKSPKMLSLPIRNRYYETLGSSVIISPMSHTSLVVKNTYMIFVI